MSTRRKGFIKGPSGRQLRPLTRDRDMRLRSRLAAMDMTTADAAAGLPAEADSTVASYATADFDVRRLRGLEIMILGAGSVGGYLAWALAQAQLKIHLFDSKKVERKHTRSGRTIYDHSQIGQFKVHAAREKIERNFTGTTLVPAAYDVGEVPDGEWVKRFQKAALVVVVIDDPAQIVRINRLGYSITELLQCGVHRQGRSSHIAFSIPQQTPCLACTLGISSAQDIRRLDSEPAAGIDISLTAQLGARLAMDLLHRKVTGQPISRWDATKNLVYISNTQDITPDGPGIVLESAQRRPACSICH